MYKINELAAIANISTRTLRHYDDVGLLVPLRSKESSYRLYTEKDIDKLQTILFYKELGYELKEIKKIISNPSYNLEDSLHKLEDSVQKRIDSLHQVLHLIKQTKLHQKGVITLSNKDKFEAFKEKQIQDNTENYGEELKQFDQEMVKKANQKYKSKSKNEMKEHDVFTEKMHQVMKKAIHSNDPSNTISQQMCEMHKKWLLFYWPSYSKEAHLSLCEMYTTDERFRAYYDKIEHGLADYLYQAMTIYVK